MTGDAESFVVQPMTGFDVFVQTRDLKDLLINGFVNKVQQIASNAFKFKLSTSKGSRDLVFVLDKGLFLSNFSYIAPKNPSSFSVFLRSRLSGQKIVRVEQHGLDRACFFELNDFFLVFELFGSGNLILTDKDWKILTVFKPHKWKDRDLHKGETYLFPASLGVNPLTVGFSDFKNTILGSERNLISSIVSGFGVAPVYAEFICSNAKLDKALTPRDLKGLQVHDLFDSFQVFLKKVRESKGAVTLQIGERFVVFPFKP
ncbi:MAG: hypothetical protein GOV15_03105, partial [Candidatus Diapherotrites archaeon]|nr:hypothetical protein [Candidatus Diapherotrites archaeon]